MPGPVPKDPSVRQRRNRTSTAAFLTAQPDAVVPELGFEVTSRTESWWRDVWTSPMAAEFDSTDRHGLAMLAMLVDAFWKSTLQVSGEGPAADPLKLLAEIRQQSQRYGLSPIDRRRLQWEIERTEEAKAHGERRRSVQPKSSKDPRATLRAV